MPVTYERHVLSKDRWTTEQTTPGDHKRRAPDHARELYGEPHITAVKAISGTDDEATNQWREATIFAAAPGPGKAAARQRGALPTAPKLALIAAMVVPGFIVSRGSEMLSGLG